MTPPEPRSNPELFGHDEAARTLEAAARAGRMHHAWLIAGPQGVGKATLAFRFARWLLAGRPAARPGEMPLALPADHPVFRRVAAAGHADMLDLAPNTDGGVKRVLRVDDARRAARFFSLTAAEGGWRVVLIDELEKTDNLAVPNILLKTLEEPPPRAILLITSHAPDRLLPTIRSRCRRLDLAPLPAETMDPLLAGWLPELKAEERAVLAALADGAPGRALALAAGQGLALQALVDQALGALPGLDARAAHGIADQLRDAAALSLFFALLRRALAGGAREAGRGRAAPAWVGLRSLADWAGLWDKLGRLAEETDRLNLDRKQAVVTGLSWLAAG